MPKKVWREKRLRVVFTCEHPDRSALKVTSAHTIQRGLYFRENLHYLSHDVVLKILALVQSDEWSR